jgi:hypothetical protein
VHLLNGVTYQQIKCTRYIRANAHNTKKPRIQGCGA